MKALLVDSSLFTAPYDAGLTEGLVQAGVLPSWATRPVRPGDRAEIPPQYVDAFFYRWVDTAEAVPRALRPVAKGLAHLLGLGRLLAKVALRRPDVVHFQWIVVPPLDVVAIFLLRLCRPVVLTVHDTVPFNGERMSFLQNAAFDLPIRIADHVIVHTQAGRQRLVQRGLPAHKISVVPHGPLRLHALPDASFAASLGLRDQRRLFLLFGEIKPYKGLDVLVEGVGRLPAQVRDRMRIVVAGRPRMDLEPIIARIRQLGLVEVFDIRPKRLSEEEMAALFQRSDCFVFPYRQIDASGVYFLAKSFGKWMIASRVGIFAEDLRPGLEGALVDVEDADGLAVEMARFVASPPLVKQARAASGWAEIGQATRTIYASVIKPIAGRA